MDFAVTILQRDVKIFDRAGFGFHALIGQRIRVRGLLDLRFGPQIEVSEPDAIEIVSAARGCPWRGPTLLRQKLLIRPRSLNEGPHSMIRSQHRRFGMLLAALAFALALAACAAMEDQGEKPIAVDVPAAAPRTLGLETPASAENQKMVAPSAANITTRPSSISSMTSC